MDFHRSIELGRVHARLLQGLEHRAPPVLVLGAMAFPARHGHPAMGHVVRADGTPAATRLHQGLQHGQGVRLRGVVAHHVFEPGRDQSGALRESHFPSGRGVGHQVVEQVRVGRAQRAPERVVEGLVGRGGGVGLGECSHGRTGSRRERPDQSTTGAGDGATWGAWAQQAFQADRRPLRGAPTLSVSRHPRRTGLLMEPRGPPRPSCPRCWGRRFSAGKPGPASAPWSGADGRHA